MNNKFNFQLNSLKNRGDYVIFALPQSNQYQRIEELSYNKKPLKIIREKRWNNRVAVFRLNDVKDKVGITFALTLKVVRAEIPSTLTLRSNPRETFSAENYHFKADRLINGKDPAVIALVKDTVGERNNLKFLIKKLYDFTLEYLTYGNPMEGLYSYKQAMEERTTDCGGFSTFLASLLQSVGIPSRLAVGFLIRKNRIKDVFSMLHVTSCMFHDLLMHAWLEVLLPDGTMFPLDPSIEWRRAKRLTKREGGFGEIPADRLVLSYGQGFSFKIDKKRYNVDLLQYPIYL